MEMSLADRLRKESDWWYRNTDGNRSANVVALFREAAAALDQDAARLRELLSRARIGLPPDSAIVAEIDAALSRT